jgi:hypothetical protein
MGFPNNEGLMPRRPVPADTIIAEIRWILMMQGVTVTLPHPRPAPAGPGKPNWKLDKVEGNAEEMDALSFALGVAMNRYDLAA